MLVSRADSEGMSRDGESPERSALQEAASRKQGEPHILGVEGEAPAETTAPLQIDVDEFEEALRDPERQGFLREAHCLRGSTTGRATHAKSPITRTWR